VIGKASCYWCACPIEDHDLRMGDVVVIRRGNTSITTPFEPKNFRNEEWEEELHERRPFHSKCWDDYRKRR
jgi:hypothetical protein